MACTEYARKTRGGRFHHVPREPNLYQAWVERIGRENSEQVTTSVGCSDHLEMKDCEDDPCIMQKIGFSRRKHYLKPYEVPSIFALG